MMRRLIFCFDGSWSKLSNPYPTNIVLIAEAIIPICDNGDQQIVYYDEGVGTQKGEILRGGAFGKGVRVNLLDAYRFLIFNYRPNDEIFVFGFSRGAFTASAFVGFIKCCGILKVHKAKEIEQAWKLYNKFASRIGADPEPLRNFRLANCPGLCVDQDEYDWRKYQDKEPDTFKADIVQIKYLGVLDTVGSLGWR